MPVQNLFLDEDFNRAYIRNIFHLTKSVTAVLTSLLLPFSSLPTLDREPTKSLMPIDHFLGFKSEQHLLAPTSSLALILPSLSELQLSLLIAAARLDVIHDSDTCSFGMAYAQYVELASKARLHSAAAGALATGAGARVWGREVARGEWEVLIRRGLLLPVSEAGGAGSVASVGGLVKVDVRLEEISGAVQGMSSVMERWCKQI
jgi:origin recognition complex subunit 4